MGYGIKMFVPRPLHYVTRSPGFPVLDSRTSDLHVCSRDVSIYVMGLKMAAVEALCEESLFQASNVINLENVSVRKR